jgi:glucan phosphoethanolaminetransferase (alkaline phosphatase superfamily)
MHHNHNIRLAIMAVLSFVAMYILMYAMVDEFGSVFNNINQAYMAALMAAPMVIIEIAVMSSMYRNRTANAAIIGLSVLVLAGSFFFIRQQTAVGDAQFLRSMIPTTPA